MSDSMFPNVLHVDDQGRVTAEFAGHVIAAGLDLPESDSLSAEDDSKVRWLDESGVETQSIVGLDAPGVGQYLALFGKPPSTDAMLLLGRDDFFLGGHHQALLVQVEGLFKRIMDGAGRSDFLAKVQGADADQVAYDSAVVTWPGGTTFSDIVTVNHGLGGVPKHVEATSVFVAGPEMYVAGVATITAASFKLRARASAGTVPGAGTTASIPWKAIG